MMSGCRSSLRMPHVVLLLLLFSYPAHAGVSRVIQQQIQADYANKALVLKIPAYTDRQLIHISGRTFRVEPGSGIPRFKVGEQLRIMQVQFSNDEIRMRMSPITSSETIDLVFKFDSALQDDFPNRNVFDQALAAVLTDGLKYSEIEDAQRAFVKNQFERSVRDIAGAASISRDSTLESIAPLLPAHQKAQREIDVLQDRLQKLSTQLSGSREENQNLESQVKSLKEEAARLKSAHASVQDKMKSSVSQISRLSEELKDAQGTAQGYQKELASIQRTLNLKVDAGKDLSRQIADLGQAMRSLQKEKEALQQKTVSLQKELEALQATNVRMLKETETLKAEGAQMQRTIQTLTSKEDSLGRRYLNLQHEKEKLDAFERASRFLRARIVEEKTEDGAVYGKTRVWINDLAFGTLEWRMPVSAAGGRPEKVEASFTAESIDYVRATPEEKALLRTLGDPLKIGIELTSASPSVRIDTARETPILEIRERERALWEWTLNSQGTQDARLLFSVHLINQNAQTVFLFQREPVLMASNAVQQVRKHLQPVPMAAGAFLGILAVAAVSAFRRRKRPLVHTPQPLAVDETPPHTHKKEL